MKKTMKQAHLFEIAAYVIGVIVAFICTAIFVYVMKHQRGYRIDCTTYEFSPDSTQSQKQFCRGMRWKATN